jgi:hypothetical protein
MPVDGRWLPECVSQDHAHALPLGQPDLGTRDLAVVGHGLDHLPRGKLPPHLARLEMELPHGARGNLRGITPPRQNPDRAEPEGSGAGQPDTLEKFPACAGHR